MGQDFLTPENIVNFSFIIIVVVVATEFTKRILGYWAWWRDKTEFIVFAYSLVLSIARTSLNPDVKWEDCFTVFINVVFIVVNAMLIGYFAISGYSKLVDNRNGQPKSSESNSTSTN